MNSLFDLIVKLYEYFIKEDFVPLFLIIMTILFVITFKFIYLNRLSFKEKKLKFEMKALEKHLKVQKNIYLFKNNEISKSDLIESLYSIVIYNNNSFLNLLNNFSYENEIKDIFISIENTINSNIETLQYNKQFKNILIYINHFLKVITNFN